MATPSARPVLLSITDLDKVLSVLEGNHFPDHQWDDLGLKLGITKPVLDTIRKDKQDSKDCLKECLSRWLQQNYDTTQYGLPKMESLAAALRGMGQKAVASSVTRNLAERKSPAQHVPSKKRKKETHTLESDVNKSLERLRSTFSNLVTEVRSQLAQHIEDGFLKLIRIARNLEEHLRVTGLTGVTCIDKLFNSIQAHYYYLNCSVIKHIVKTFLTHNEEDRKLQEEMESYACELESFNESTKLVELQSAIRKVLPSRYSVSDTSCEFFLKLKGQWERETIKDLERFLQHYFCRNDLFNYIDIKQGCIQVTFLVPRSYFQHLIDMVTPSKIKSMYRVGVLQLVINSYVLLDKKNTINIDESLMEAVKLNDTFEVSVLLSLGADPYYQDDNGDSPMMLALLGKSGEVKRLLGFDEAKIQPVDVAGVVSCPTTGVHDDEKGVEIHVPRSKSNEFSSIRSSFGRMIYNVSKAIARNSPPLDELKEFLYCYSSGLKTKLDNCDSVRSVVQLIQEECTLTDIELLEAVIEEFEVIEAEKYIEEYKRSLKLFYESLSVSLCLKEKFKAVKASPLKNETATYVFDWRPEEKMLQDITDILAKISGKLVRIKYIDTN